MNKFPYDIDKVRSTPHHPAMGELVDLLCHRTGNVNREFFQAEVAYFLALIPAALRVMISSPERGLIPVNVYSIALATSGFGKGHSVSIMEDIISGFRQVFADTVMPQVAEKNLFNIANHIAASKSSNEAEELLALEQEYKRYGTAPFIFDSGTAPAVKQLRSRLLMATCGSINFQMDEIGSNLPANAEVLNVLLELYDLGRVKTKLIKNTSDNERGADLVGDTPANVLMFGTTSKLLDGAKIEGEFFDFLETGYARRSLFGMGKAVDITMDVNPADVYKGLVNKTKSMGLSRWKTTLQGFADETYLNQVIDVPEAVGIELVAYRLFCEAEAATYPEHEAVRKAEMAHRYFKALKLAGVYAFLDVSTNISMDNLHQAIRVVEESGDSFQTLLYRERNFTRLARYIAESDGELTHADLVEDLPYYPNSATPRREIMDLAMGWAARNHVVIRKNVISGVEFFSGSSLKETDLDKMRFSFSQDFASDYIPQERAFDKFPKLLGADGLHWSNHHFKDMHRSEDDTIPGFNMLVVDVDGGSRLEDIQEILRQYAFITATTKRHTDADNRFRLIMPTNYVLELEREDYRQFMKGFLSWLPFKSDDAAEQRSKKWLTCGVTEEGKPSEVFVNKGTDLVDVLPFIPKTKLNDEFVDGIKDLGQLDNLERWFLTQLDVGSRNNQMIRFAMMLKDGGLPFNEVEGRVLSLNERSGSPLKKSELQDTVLKTLARSYV